MAAGYGSGAGRTRPPRMNAARMKRRGHSAEVIHSLHRAFHLLLSSKLNTSQALEKIKEEIKDAAEVDGLVEFIKS